MTLSYITSWREPDKLEGGVSEAGLAQIGTGELLLTMHVGGASQHTGVLQSPVDPTSATDADGLQAKKVELR